MNCFQCMPQNVHSFTPPVNSCENHEGHIQETLQFEFSVSADEIMIFTKSWCSHVNIDIFKKKDVKEAKMLVCNTGVTFEIHLKTKIIKFYFLIHAVAYAFDQSYINAMIGKY